MPVGTAQFGQAYLSKTETQPKPQRRSEDAPLYHAHSLTMFDLFHFLFSISPDAGGDRTIGEADLSKPESHTDAQMTQLGAATSGLIIARVWFVLISFFVDADASRCRAAASYSFCFVFRVFFQLIFSSLNGANSANTQKAHIKNNKEREIQ